MAGVLTKTTVLLDFHSSDADEVQFYTAGGDRPHDLDFYLDRATWEDLGEPRVITVTVEPGDKLNGEGA